MLWRGGLGHYEQDDDGSMLASEIGSPVWECQQCTFLNASQTQKLRCSVCTGPVHKMSRREIDLYHATKPPLASVPVSIVDHVASLSAIFWNEEMVFVDQLEFAVQPKTKPDQVRSMWETAPLYIQRELEKPFGVLHDILLRHRPLVKLFQYTASLPKPPIQPLKLKHNERRLTSRELAEQQSDYDKAVKEKKQSDVIAIAEFRQNAINQIMPELAPPFLDAKDVALVVRTIAEYTINDGLAAHLLRYVVPAVAAWVPLFTAFINPACLEKLRHLKEACTPDTADFHWFNLGDVTVKQVMIAPYLRLRRYVLLARALHIATRRSTRIYDQDSETAYRALAHSFSLLPDLGLPLLTKPL